MAELLQREHGVLVETWPPTAPEDRQSRRDYTFDEAGKRLWIKEATPIATRRFQIARLLCSLSLCEVIDQELEAAEILTTAQAKSVARAALSSYAAGALLMVYERFFDDAVQLHRLVTLRRPDAAGIPFAFMRSDPAGFITKRFALPRLPIPRYGNACPLWAVYNAFQTPGTIVREIAELPTGDRFLFIARTTAKSPIAFRQNRQVVSIMLACDAINADQTIYADGLDMSAAEMTTPIGVTCRLCQRDACRHREEDPILGSLARGR